MILTNILLAFVGLSELLLVWQLRRAVSEMRGIRRDMPKIAAAQSLVSLLIQVAQRAERKKAAP